MKYSYVRPDIYKKTYKFMKCQIPGTLPIRKEVIDIIEEKYKILDIVDLFWNISDIDEVLSSYKNHSFDRNQRILILHHDVDYYDNLNGNGYTLYNFLQIVREYQIPTEFLIVVTNHFGITKEIQDLCSSIFNLTPLLTVETPLFPELIDNSLFNNVAVEFKKPETLFCCLNGLFRSHRILTLCYLKEKNLIDKGMISYHFKNENI